MKKEWDDVLDDWLERVQLFLFLFMCAVIFWICCE